VSEDDKEVLKLNQYSAYEYKKIPSSKGENEISNYFSYTIHTNDTLSVYLFNKNQYNTWCDMIRSVNNTNFNSKEATSLPSIESIVKKKENIKHISSCDCPSKTKSCEKKLCMIDEDIFYLVIYGYSDKTSYELTEVEGDFSLKDILNNGQSTLSKQLNNNFIPGKAYKTSFIGMAENEYKDNKEFDAGEENDILKKMIYIAIVVIPSIIIFLLLLFLNCHHGHKLKNKNILYNLKEKNDKSLSFQPFMKNHKSKSKKKKPFYSFSNGSSTLPNDRSKISGVNSSISNSKGVSTIYGNSMDASSSASFNPYEEPFGGKYISKRLDAPMNETLSPPANINIPYKHSHYDQNDQPDLNKYSHSNSYYNNTLGPNRTMASTSNRLMMEEKSEDIVNTSIGHVEGEEFDNTKNIYIKINRSTNKYNTEEYLKENSINKIKEKHSCITQLSQFFNENTDNAIVNDSASSSASSVTISSSDNEEAEKMSKKLHKLQHSTSHDLLMASIRKPKKNNDGSTEKLSGHTNSIISLEDEEDSDGERNSFISDFSLPAQAQPQNSNNYDQKLDKSDSYYRNKNKNISTHTFGNSNITPESEEPSPSLPSNQYTTPTKYMNRTIIGRLIYTFYYSSTRILNVDEIVKVKKLFDNMWVKVERNPKEFFIIPLLVLEVSYDDLKDMKRFNQKYRTKPGKEERSVNERVEPNPEYLYHCAYISFKDFQRMKQNDKWTNKVKALSQYAVAPNQSFSVITPSTSSYISSASSIPSSPTSSAAPKKSRPNYNGNGRGKNVSKVELQSFMDDNDNKNTSYVKKKVSHSDMKNRSKSRTPRRSANPFTDSVRGIDVNVSTSQDDIIIKEKPSKVEEEFYHFENVSDPGMSSHSNINIKVKLKDGQ